MAVPVESAVRVVEAVPLAIYEQRSGREVSRSAACETGEWGRNWCVVEEDRSGLFSEGARFLALSVWGCGGKEPPRPGELPAGIVLTYHADNVRVARFVFDGVQLWELVEGGE